MSLQHFRDNKFLFEKLFINFFCIILLQFCANFRNAQDRGRYQNHFSYPMPPMADGTHLHNSYPTGAAAGWGVGQTGSGGTGQSGYG